MFYCNLLFYIVTIIPVRGYVNTFLGIYEGFFMTINERISEILTSHKELTEDDEWLSLIHQLPTEAQHEFRGEIKGYLKRLNEESVAADPPLKKTGTTNSVK